MPKFLGGCGMRNPAPMQPEVKRSAPEALERADELISFDQLLTALSVFGQALTSAGSALEGAPAPLMKELTSAFPQGDLLLTLSSRFDACASQLQEGKNHAGRVQLLVEAARSKGAEVREALRRRDEAWGPKIEGDARAEVLKRRFGKTFTLEEKKERLQAKAVADADFKKCSDVAAAALEGFLQEKWKVSAAILAEACSCYAAVFAGSQQLGKDFESMSKELLGVPPVDGGGDSVRSTMLALERMGTMPSSASAGTHRSSPEAASPDVDAGSPVESVPEEPREVGRSLRSFGWNGVRALLGGSLQPAKAPAPPAPPTATSPAALSPAAEPSAVAAAPPPTATAVPAEAAAAAGAAPGVVVTTAVLPPTVSGEAAAPGRPPAATAVPAGAAGQATTTAPANPGAATLAAEEAVAGSFQAARRAVQGMNPGAETIVEETQHSASGYRMGEKVQIWSSSRSTWLDGVVDKIYNTEGVADGYRVPAGVIKITFDQGVKYVRPDQIEEQVRRPA